MTSKKVKLQNELSESVKANSTDVNCCPSCHSHFSCALSRESHFELYPLHLSDGVQVVKAESALTEDLNGKISRGKRQ